MKYPTGMRRLGSPKPPKPPAAPDDSAPPEEPNGGLSVFFTFLCIVDLFGVFPVVALPKSVIICGVYGVPLVLGVFGLQLYTAALLGRSWLLAQEIMPAIREKNRFPYAAVAELAFGKYARWLVIFLIDATVFSAGVPNFIVASQSLQLFWWKISDGVISVSYCVWMLVIGLLLTPVMWLGSPKDMKSLALTSACIVTSVAVCIWSCILLDDESPPNDVGWLTYQPRWRDLIVAYGIITFQFDIHPMLLTIQVDMKNSRQINRAVFCGFGFTAALFAVTAGLAVYRYGTHVESNILQGIPGSATLFVVSLLVTLQLLLSSAVGNSALFLHLEDLLHVPRYFCIQRCLLRSSIVAIVVFLGEAVPHFEVAMDLVGSTLTGPLMFIFPPLFFLKLCHARSNLSREKRNDALSKNGALLKNGGLLQNGGHLQNGGLLQNGELLQNGGLKHSDALEYPIIQYALETKYKTFVSLHKDVLFKEEVSAQYRVKWYDVFLAAVVVFLGVATTSIATYSSWSNAIKYAKFSQPCLVNATAAAKSFIDFTKSTYLT